MNSHFEYVSSLGALELVGVGGFLFYLFSFGAVQLGQLDGNSATYSVLNIFAASLVAVSLLAEFNLSSALIQASWIAIGLTGLILRALKSRKVRTALADLYHSEEVSDVLR
ncbi:MAG: hypothetical protein AAFQ64_06735 [Pseudomonadota bacterium]